MSVQAVNSSNGLAQAAAVKGAEKSAAGIAKASSAEKPADVAPATSRAEEARENAGSKEGLGQRVSTEA